MLRKRSQYQQAADANALLFLQSTNRVFFTRDQLAHHLEIGGRALDRILASLTARGALARFYLEQEDGEESPLHVLGVIPTCLDFRRLNYIKLPNGSYLIREASADEVSCYLSQHDLRLREDSTSKCLMVATMDFITSAICLRRPVAQSDFQSSGYYTGR